MTVEVAEASGRRTLTFAGAGAQTIVNGRARLHRVRVLTGTAVQIRIWDQIFVEADGVKVYDKVVDSGEVIEFGGMAMDFGIRIRMGGAAELSVEMSRN